MRTAVWTVAFCLRTSNSYRKKLIVSGLWQSCQAPIFFLLSVIKNIYLLSRMNKKYAYACTMVVFFLNFVI